MSEYGDNIISISDDEGNDFELLVLDEPFTGLDEDNRRKALDAIRAYSKEAIVLLVTHSREDAEALVAEIIEI